MPESSATCDVFKRAAKVCRNAHWIKVRVIAFPNAKAQTNLLQITNARNQACLLSPSGKCRQEKTYKHCHNDDDYQHFRERHCPVSLI
jgi:hypothetical protein